jgi:hypothetical protein
MDWSLSTRPLPNTTSLQHSGHQKAFDVAKNRKIRKEPHTGSKRASLEAAIDRLEPPVDMGLKLAISSSNKTTVYYSEYM